MHALIRMLFNTAQNTYHPILYFESPFPGGPEANETLLRFKSKGHHTKGFLIESDAVTETNTIAEQVRTMGYTAWISLEHYNKWGEEGIPADVITLMAEELRT